MNMSPGDTVLIEHTFNASADKVWKAWTEPFMVKKWFGSDPDGEVLHAAIDIRPGGFFEVTFRDSGGMQHICSGMYKEVQPYAKLSFTWAWKNEPGVESVVTIWLEPEGAKTLMKFEHAQVGFASAHNYKKGWSDTFLKLDKVLAI